MWNNAEHLEAYLAIPSMGAVLHTLNIRLAPAQVGYIATHAEDHGGHRGRLPGAAAGPGAAARRDRPARARHRTGGGCRRRPELAGPEREVHSTRSCWPPGPTPTTGPTLDELSAASMCYTSGTTGNPKGVVYSHRSLYLHALAPSFGNAFALSEQDRVLPVVPMFHANAWGLPFAACWPGPRWSCPTGTCSAGRWCG